MSRLMTREQKITDLIINDINSIIESYGYGDTSFIDSVLRGDGWIQYNNLTDEEIDTEWYEQFEDLVDEN